MYVKAFRVASAHNIVQSCVICLIYLYEEVGPRYHLTLVALGGEGFIGLSCFLLHFSLHLKNNETATRKKSDRADLSRSAFNLQYFLVKKHVFPYCITYLLNFGRGVLCRCCCTSTQHVD